MISFSNKQNAAMGFLLLLFVFTTPFPAGAQSIINLGLNTSTGIVTWNPIRNVTRHVLYFYMGCRGPVREVEIPGSASSYQVPDYQPGLAVYLKLTFYYISPISHEEVIRNQTSDLQSDGDVSCWIPPRPQSLPKVGSGNPSGVPQIEVRFTGSGKDTRVFYRFVANAYIYELSYSKCGGPWASSIGTNLHGVGRHSQAHLPDYDDNVRYEVIVRALKEDAGHYTGVPYSVVGRGSATNGGTCDPSKPPEPAGGVTQYGAVFTSTVPEAGTNGAVSVGGISPGTGLSPDTNVSGTLGWVDDGSMPPPMTPVALPAPSDGTITLSPDLEISGTLEQVPVEINVVKENKVVAQHAGSSLVVYIDEGGNINAKDADKGHSLSAIGRCKPGDTLATSDHFVISCTADGQFRVLQVQPQHPQDKRRDLVVFDASISSCYRAYEYLDTGRTEIYWSKC